MKRRAVLAGGAAFAIAGPARRAMVAEAPAAGWSGVPAGGMLGFEVVRDGCRIGTHRMQFSQSAGLLTVRTQVSMKVGIGPLVLYRYRHQAVERWQDGRFAALETDTNDDGTRCAVRAARRPDAVLVASSKDGQPAPLLMLPPASIPLTHWNQAVTASPLFDPQSGAAAQETVIRRGPAEVTLGNGGSVRAERYDFAGKATLSNWYDESRIWTALRATVKDGSTLDYRRAV